MTTCKDYQSVRVIYPFDVKPFVSEINLIYTIEYEAETIPCIE